MKQISFHSSIVDVKSQCQYVMSLDKTCVYYHNYHYENKINSCFFLFFFGISSNFTYNKLCVLPVTKDEMGQINEQV